jgi:hypothetical protein
MKIRINKLYVEQVKVSYVHTIYIKKLKKYHVSVWN